ncbi:MAG: VanZ family protein [Clostridium sp.]
MIRKRILWLLILCCFLGLFFLSSQPAPKSARASEIIAEHIVRWSPSYRELPPKKQKIELSRVNELVRDSGHVIVFLVIAILLSLLLRMYCVRNSFLITMILCMLCAIFDEFHQDLFTPGRGYEFIDLVKDFCGSLVGAGGVWLVMKKRS